MPFWRPHMCPNRLATVVAPGEERRVGRDLLDDVALAGAARAELDEVVVALRKGDEPGQEKQLQPTRHLAGLVAHAAQHEVEPLVRRELAADTRYSSRSKVAIWIGVSLSIQNGFLPLRLLVVLEAHVDLRPDAAHQQALVVANVVARDVHELVAEVDSPRPSSRNRRGGPSPCR